MNDRVSVGEVKNLGGGKFSVRLNFDAGSPGNSLSQTQTVLADGYDAAVRIAKEAFLRWLKKVQYVVKNANWGNHRSN